MVAKAWIPNVRDLARVLIPVFTIAKRATLYLSPNLVVRATRFAGSGNAEVYLAVGKPNFAERKFISDCKKAGEPFPVKKVQLKGR